MSNNKSVTLITYGIFLTLFSAAGIADTVLTNVNGYTSSNDGIRRFSVMVLGRDGRVVATGGDELTKGRDAAALIDLEGRTLLPGLIDAHGHVFGLGFALESLDLVGSDSIDVVRERLRDYAAANPTMRWIQGHGWNQVLWPGRAFPEASDIDSIVSDRPVWLRRIDGHAAWGNSAAMRLAGIDDDTPDPVGGRIMRDQYGHATGLFIDAAMELIDRHLPLPDKADYRRLLGAAIERLLSEGITSVHDAGIELANAEAYVSMAHSDELRIRIYAMTAGAGEVLDAIGKPLKSEGRDRLDIAAVKLYADGALGSRGAAMLAPYSDDPENRGLRFWRQSELDAMVEKANNMGFQVGIHAIGDLGNRMALDALERAQRGRPSPLRNRIEHAQIIALEDLPRFAELGVIASMQPTHATSDMNMAEDRVGSERIAGGYAWHKILASGAVLAAGSDFPVERANPFHGLYAAVTRQSRDGEPPGGWYTGEAMTRAEALHAFTLAAAYAAHQEERLGSLEPGKWADFIVVDRDYFEVPVDQIDDIEVLQTWVGGEKVYDRAETEQLP